MAKSKSIKLDELNFIFFRNFLLFATDNEQ